MDSLLLSFEDWLALTTALTMALTPGYYLIWQMKTNVAVLTSIISRCRYCNKKYETVDLEKWQGDV